MVDGGDGSSSGSGLDGLLGRDGESTNLGEGGRLDDTLDSGKDGGHVKGGEILGANELEQVGDEDDLKRTQRSAKGEQEELEGEAAHGLALDDGSTLAEGTSEEGSDDGKGRAINLANPDGGGETLDGGGDGGRVGHALDEVGHEGLDVGVGEDMAKSDTSLLGGRRDL